MNVKTRLAGRVEAKWNNSMLQNGQRFNNRNPVVHAAGALRTGRTSLDPKDRLALRVETLYHRDRLGIEPASPAAVRAILAEYVSSQETAGQ